jgi:transcriptional regulator with XRE-family HTH domain
MYFDLSTILGRVIAALRGDTRESQARFGDAIGWDRSLLSRIESGRNTATIDNIVELGELFLQRGLIGRRGDLVDLTCLVVDELVRRGHHATYGLLRLPDGEHLANGRELDRIVAVVLDGWQRDREDEARR